MTAFLQLAVVLVILLICAKAAGYISSLLGQPAVLGEILIGLILGPSLVDVTHLIFITDTHLGEVIAELGEIGVLLLMFLAGLELHLSDLAKNTRVSALSGTLGVIIPVILGWLVGLLFKMPSDHAIYLGLTLGATSVSISAQTLMELKMLRSRVGLGLMGAAVFDDILVILLLSIFLAVEGGGGGALDVLLVFIKMAAYLGLAVAVGVWALPRLSERISKLPISQGTVTFAIVTLLTFGIAAELIGGMAAITGAFLAGLMFSRTSIRAPIESGVRSLAYGFFVPVFFVDIGLRINILAMDVNAIWIILAVSAVSILGKILGAGLGARLSKFTNLESLQLGIGMVSRGEVGLIVANVGLSQGLLTADTFSAIIGMVLISTVITPPMLRAAFARPTKPSEPQLISDKEVS